MFNVHAPSVPISGRTIFLFLARQIGRRPRRNIKTFNNTAKMSSS
jgi:hypothetical protein